MVDVDTNFDRIRRGVWVGPNAAKPYVEWNDLSRVLTDLLKWARSPESREKFDEVMYDSLKSLLKAANNDVKNKVENLSKLTQRDVDTVTVTIIATANIIRLLRNSVINLPRNQFLQVKTGLLDCILDSVYFYHDVGTKCHRVKHKIPYVLTYTPLCIEVIRAALQLTSNLCVGNHAVQGAVWARLYPGMFNTLLSSIDKQVKNYVCAILFHCTAWNGSAALEVANEIFKRVKRHNSRNQVAVRNSKSENPKADRKSFLDSPLDDDLVARTSSVPTPVATSVTAPAPVTASAPIPAQRTLRPRPKQTSIIHCQSCRPSVVYRYRFIKSNNRSNSNSVKRNLSRQSKEMKALKTTNKDQSLQIDRLQAQLNSWKIQAESTTASLSGLKKSFADIEEEWKASKEELSSLKDLFMIFVEL
ncbi:uncharacterized protein LOC134818082 [Bolinopsis microptera]|uniref:uncharacterized protein LOC134818082 n=1 Tax=Bolinopsis microptera TaxID=2820187 RepID=UPI00307969FF